MRSAALFALAAALLCQSAGAGSHRDVSRRAARADFEKRFLVDFQGRTAVPAEAVEEKDRYYSSRGRSVWRFMLQVGGDGRRVRYIDAVFSSGRFQSGRMYVFGLKEKKLNSRQFAEIADEFVLAGIPVNARRNMPVTLYRRRPVKLERPVGPHVLRSFAIHPIAELWGEMPGIVARRKVDVSGVGCEVEFISADGKKGELGRFFPGQGKDSYGPDALRDALKNVFSKNGLDVSLFNDRRTVDAYSAGRIVFKPFRADVKDGRK